MKNALFLLAFALFAASAFGQAGALDSTFGVGGKIIPNPNSSDYVERMALRSDGKIVVAGSAYSIIQGAAIAVARYHPGRFAGQQLQRRWAGDDRLCQW